ncbi:putative Ig domain-containing protein [Sporosarcina obsidiansis]|uniref:putative Ig domain-containing protein n=1 Tax=Sporosarcina obsidiansis TaxID=2660748 RepID=UPI00129AAD62|nr:putative Ig domain-containing protein [Sporosarcina obsidiansis]
MKNVLNKLAAFLIILGVVGVSSFIGEKANAETLEVGESRSLGTKVEVPVTVRDISYLSSGNFVISAPPASSGIVLKSFRPAPAFDNTKYRTKWNVLDNALDINFLSNSDKDVIIPGKKITVGYLVYELSSSFAEGESLDLTITSANMKGRANADLPVNGMNGKVIRKMPFGDVVGNNKPTAAAAIRILQHLNNPITDREAFLSADVDGDGVLTQADAQIILDYIAGKRTSFLAIQAKELDNAVLKSEYSEEIEGLHGREPYQFKRVSGSMPAGVTIDLDTGKISGTPTRAGNYNFTIQVTDALGDTERRIFSMDVIDSNIQSVEKLLQINVKLNGTPELPSKVKVTYKDKTTGMESVNWQPVDTSKIGMVIAKGKIGDSGFTVSVEVNVVSADYLNSVKISYVQFLNLHTIQLNVSSDVYKVTINDVHNMHYEGQNKFSLGSSSFSAGSTVVIRMYDKYGNILQTKQQALIPN